MFRKLRYLLLVTPLSWGIAACQSGVEEPATGTADNEITFNPEVATRSSLVSKENITSLPFSVFSGMNNMVPQTDSKFHIIQNPEEVRYDPSSDKWVCKTPSFWFPGFQHSFVALYPADAPALSSTLYSESQLKFTYNYPTGNFNDATDLLVSTHRRNYNGGQTDPVRFRFSHILSKINVTVVYVSPPEASNGLAITDITFKNIPVRSDYAITPASINGDDNMTYDFEYPAGTLDGWAVAERGDLNISFDESGENSRIIPINLDPINIFSSDDSLLLLPNPDADTEMTITYKILDHNGSPEREVTSSVTIPKGWDPGLTYTLSLSITNRKILFSFDVADWIPTDPITTVVPRK